MAHQYKLTQAVATCIAATPNYGSPGCVCGSHATPARECPIHYTNWILERFGFKESELEGREVQEYVNLILESRKES